jgi:hypothetical protein
VGGLPTKLSDLVEGYEILRSTSQQDPLYADNGRTILLYDEQSVRVYLTREPQTWKDISLEVEVFLSTPEGTKTASRSKEAGARSELLKIARCLDYLLRLERKGFTLDPFAGDCVWTARRVLEAKPDAHLYKIVFPPEASD